MCTAVHPLTSSPWGGTPSRRERSAWQPPVPRGLPDPGPVWGPPPGTAAAAEPPLLWLRQASLFVAGRPSVWKVSGVNGFSADPTTLRYSYAANGAPPLCWRWGRLGARLRRSFAAAFEIGVNAHADGRSFQRAGEDRAPLCVCKLPPDPGAGWPWGRVAPLEGGPCAGGAAPGAAENRSVSAQC